VPSCQRRVAHGGSGLPGRGRSRAWVAWRNMTRRAPPGELVKRCVLEQLARCLCLGELSSGHRHRMWQMEWYRMHVHVVLSPAVGQNLSKYGPWKACPVVIWLDAEKYQQDAFDKTPLIKGGGLLSSGGWHDFQASESRRYEGYSCRQAAKLAAFGGMDVGYGGTSASASKSRRASLRILPGMLDHLTENCQTSTTRWAPPERKVLSASVNVHEKPRSVYFVSNNATSISDLLGRKKRSQVVSERKKSHCFSPLIRAAINAPCGLAASLLPHPTTVPSCMIVKHNTKG